MKYNYKDLKIWNALYLNPDLHKSTFNEIANEVSKSIPLSLLYIKFKLLYFRLKGILIKISPSSYILKSNIFPPISDNTMSHLITTTNIDEAIIKWPNYIILMNESYLLIIKFYNIIILSKERRSKNARLALW